MFFFLLLSILLSLGLTAVKRVTPFTFSRFSLISIFLQEINGDFCFWNVYLARCNSQRIFFLKHQSVGFFFFREEEKIANRKVWNLIFEENIIC